MAEYVSSFELYGNEILLKDKEARDNLIEVNKNITNINNSIETMDKELEDVSGKIEEKYSKHYRRHIYGNYYADVRGGVTLEQIKVSEHSGSDNDPYESLDYFFNDLNKGQTDIRCYITQSGTYVVKQPVFRNCIIHITVRANNVRIIWNTESLSEDFVGYNTHVNFKVDEGYTKCVFLTPNENNQMYFENSAVLIDGVTYDGTIKLYGGYLSMGNSNVGSMELLGCSGYMHDVYITNSDVNKNGIWLRRGSNFIFAGSIADFKSLGSQGNSSKAMIKCEDCRLTLEYAQNVPSNYYNGIIADGALIFVTEGRLNSFANNCISGQNLLTNTLVVHSNATLS